MVDRIPAHITTQDRRAIGVLVQRLLLEHSNDILYVKLFGSKARGDDKLHSDIDILVVVTDDDWRLKHKLRTLGARVSLNTDVLFNLYVIDQERWTWMGEVDHPLYRQISDEGVDLTMATV